MIGQQVKHRKSAAVGVVVDGPIHGQDCGWSGNRYHVRWASGDEGWYEEDDLEAA